MISINKAQLCYYITFQHKVQAVCVELKYQMCILSIMIDFLYQI